MKLFHHEWFALYGMFLIHINDIASNMSSTCRFFADDCIIYHSIELKHDCICLQHDLNHFSQWNKVWQMKGNITKCAVIHCSRSTTSQYNYNINHQPLDITDLHPYLGVTIHKSMSWTSHINTIRHQEHWTLSSDIFICAQKKLKKQPILPL